MNSATLRSPHPALRNSAPSLGIVERVTASLHGGFFTTPISVSLDSPTPGAEIRYTLDGSTPTATHGAVYSAPIVVSGTTSLRAAAFLTDYIALPSMTRTYVFPDDVIEQSGDGSSPAGWPTSWGSNAVDYGMDPDVVYRDRDSAERHRCTVGDSQPGDHDGLGESV